MGRAAACKTSSPQEALTRAASLLRRVTVRYLSFRLARLIHLCTASAWQAETRLGVRLYNWIAFIAPNRSTY